MTWGDSCFCAVSYTILHHLKFCYLCIYVQVCILHHTKFCYWCIYVWVCISHHAIFFYLGRYVWVCIFHHTKLLLVYLCLGLYLTSCKVLLFVSVWVHLFVWWGFCLPEEMFKWIIFNEKRQQNKKTYTITSEEEYTLRGCHAKQGNIIYCLPWTILIVSFIKTLTKTRKRRLASVKIVHGGNQLHFFVLHSSF